MKPRRLARAIILSRVKVEVVSVIEIVLRKKLKSPQHASCCRDGGVRRGSTLLPLFQGQLCVRLSSSRLPKAINAVQVDFTG